MQLPVHIREYLQRHIEEIKAGGPGSLSADGTALMVDGSIGYDCYVSLDGDVYIETYELDVDSPSMRDRTRRAQILALVFGCRRHPILGELLPERTQAARTCDACAGTGFVDVATARIVCNECCGLGWFDPMVFEPSAPPN
jgi:hypothetical protein